MLIGTTTPTTSSAAAQFLADIRTKNQDFYATDRGYGALKDLQQTFPHPWLYVGELLQNAVDAGAKHIRLSVDETAHTLVVEHDGKAFSEEHVEALCLRGVSKKGAGTVGFMGIGFKAVFQSFECVDISSGPWRFGFRVKEDVGELGDRQRHWLGCVLPAYDQAIALPSQGMTCRFFLHDRLQRLGPIAEDVTKVVSPDLLVLALLARRGVEEVEWAGDHWLLAQDEESVDEQMTRVNLTAYHEASERTRAWILFSSRYQPSGPAIARFLEHRQIQPRPEEKEAVYAEAQRQRTVEVFCPLDDRGFPQPLQRGEAYALLPTGVNVPLGLHVQADWLLVTSRREIMEVETNPGIVRSSRGSPALWRRTSCGSRRCRTYPTRRSAKAWRSCRSGVGRTGHSAHILVTLSSITVSRTHSLPFPSCRSAWRRARCLRRHQKRDCCLRPSDPLMR